MKLFYFYPGGFGTQAFVCAEGLKEAKEALVKSLEKVSDLINKDFYGNAVENMVHQLDGYRIEELEPNEVVFTELD